VDATLLYKLQYNIDNNRLMGVAYIWLSGGTDSLHSTADINPTTDSTLVHCLIVIKEIQSCLSDIMHRV
ncbi:hypothetical protein L9F63_022941, partial [Diploptera punctata]